MVNIAEELLICVILRFCSNRLFVFAKIAAWIFLQWLSFHQFVQLIRVFVLLRKYCHNHNPRNVFFSTGSSTTITPCMLASTQQKVSLAFYGIASNVCIFSQNFSSHNFVYYGRMWLSNLIYKLLTKVERQIKWRWHIARHHLRYLN